MNRKITGVYFSPTGGTKKTVEVIAKAIDGNVVMEDLTKLAQRLEPLSFDESDYVVVGVPVYAGRIPLEMEKYFNAMKGNDTPAVCVVVYGNRDYDDALLELTELLEKNGFRVHAGGAFIGEHSYTNLVGGGRPDQEDVEVAKDFGRTAWEKFKKLNDVSNERQPLQVKGKHPYKERMPSAPMAPITTDDCVFCGLCAEACPMEAVDFEDYYNVDATRCIRCCACIKICPQDAKRFEHPMVEKITESLIANCSNMRKDPELFF